MLIHQKYIIGFKKSCDIVTEGHNLRHVINEQYHSCILQDRRHMAYIL